MEEYPERFITVLCAVNAQNHLNVLVCLKECFGLVFIY